MNTTITEIIPKNMPDWFKKDMPDGQVFSRMVERVESFETEITELKKEISIQKIFNNTTEKVMADSIELIAHIDRFNKAESCHNCYDIGFAVVANNYTGEPEQEQCEFCYTEANSLFNVRNETPTQSLAKLQADTIEEMIEVIGKTHDGRYMMLIKLKSIVDYFTQLRKEGE